MVESTIISSTPPEYLGRPSKAFSIHAGCTVVAPSNGHELFAVVNMNEISNMELILIDPEKNDGCVFHAPNGKGSWGMLRAPNDTIVIGSFYNGEFAVFDLRKIEFIKKDIKLPDVAPNSTYISNLVLGNDGCVYGGIRPKKGSLAALNLINYEIKDCGNPNPLNDSLRCLSATPDGRILCYWQGKEPSVWLYDPSNPGLGFKCMKGEPWEVENPSAATEIATVVGASWNDLFLPRMINGGIEAFQVRHYRRFHCHSLLLIQS